MSEKVIPVSKEDVLQVATTLKKELTEKEIQNVIELYPSYQDQDPTGNWSTSVEDAIYQVIDEREEA